MSYMTKDQLENYLNGLPNKNNKEKKSEYSQLKSELVYPMQGLSVNDADDGDEEQATHETIQDRMKRLRNATGTVLNATHTQTPAFPETPKPMIPQKPSFTSTSTSSAQSDAFEASLNPRISTRRQQPVQLQQQQKPISSSPSPPQPPPPPPLRKQENSPSTPPPAVPSSPRPPKPSSNNSNQKDTMVRTLNPIYAGLECPACQKPIDGSVVSAINQIWHVHCFTCTTCHKPLEDEKYYEKDDKPYCGKDYRKLFSLHCDFCHEPIVDSAISALGKHYHEGHFCCTACRKPFGDHSPFMVHEGKPYCQEDYQKTCGKKCSGCGQYIFGEYINALDQEWHKSCFVCIDCKRPFANGTFLVKENKPYCEEHYHRPCLQQVPSSPQKPAQPPQQQEKKPSTLKPKPPVIAKKPDFSSSSKPTEPQVDAAAAKRPGINAQSSLSRSIKSTTTDSNKKTTAGSGSKKVCHRCNTVIDGSVASALGYDYHIHHFQCSRCDRALSSRVPGMWQGDKNNEILCKMCAFKKE